METTQIAQRAEGAMADGARNARSRLEDRLSDRSGPTAEQARKMADDVNAVSDELARRGRERPARMVSAAAQRAERVGDYLEAADGGRMLDDASRYGREHPATIAMAGFAAGFIAARFLKAGGGSQAPSASAAASPAVTPTPDDVRPAGAPAAAEHTASGAPSGGR